MKRSIIISAAALFAVGLSGCLEDSPVIPEVGKKCLPSPLPGIEPDCYIRGGVKVKLPIGAGSV